ncbi:RraA family protein [Roseivivax sp. THAF30]|uniref:RraA family protein n=1 Tax=Roseivivax sp. THAF30 TaxID=2587852 RepID=UPI00126895AB|nr:RraA family protein [Roseivivax sp. THAF30]QFT62023.1 4-hydroxy-4-methyl-2-oxoglutarate aldolase [Roseivivax sp. THAF30]
MTIGNQIRPRDRKVDAENIARFAELPVANVSDSMSRVFAAGPTLRPMHAKGSMAGAAITVRSRPGDNLMLHKAIDMAEPGDVIVVDAGGDLTNALMGELMLAYAVKRGVAGFVLNGAIRDVDAFVETNLPTFAAGVTHRGPYKDGPGEINVIISLDGMIIAPGDLVIGDADGVLAVPYDDLETVYEATMAKQAAEEKQMKAIAEGTNDRSWVDKALAAAGCQDLTG